MSEDTMDVMKESTEQINRVIFEIGELIEDIHDIRDELTQILEDNAAK